MSGTDACVFILVDVREKSEVVRFPTMSTNASAASNETTPLAAYDKKAANSTVSVHVIQISAEGKAVDKKLDQHTT